MSELVAVLAAKMARSADVIQISEFTARLLVYDQRMSPGAGRMVGVPSKRPVNPSVMPLFESAVPTKWRNLFRELFMERSFLL